MRMFLTFNAFSTRVVEIMLAKDVSTPKAA